MIKASETEPLHIHRQVWDLTENKAFYSGFKKFACLGSEPAGGSGAVERETIPPHLEGE